MRGLVGQPDHHSILDGHHVECHVLGVCLQRCGLHEFLDESGNQELLQILDALGEADLSEGATDEGPNAHETALSNGPGLPPTPTFPVLSTSNASIAALVKLRSS